MFYLFFFFFSSRRRHTRLQGDWSSDVCSSDLGGLTVDRPGRAVIVRRRYPRLVVDVGEDLETELRVLVEHMQAARRVLAMLADEVRVLQQLLEPRAHLFAAIGAGIARKNGTAIRYELIELIGHGVSPGRMISAHFRASGA